MKSAAIGIILSAIAVAVISAVAYEIPFDAEAHGKTQSVVHKIPISHNLEGVVERGNVLEQAPSLPDDLQIADVNGLGKATLRFVAGRLVRFMRNKSEEAREKDAAYLTDDPSSPVQLPDLWRKMPEDAQIGWKYWDKSSRLRLWFFNPNGAGTLFAEIALLLLSLAGLVVKRKIVRVVLAVGAAASVVALLMTGSRGSLLAIAAGIVVIVAALAVLNNRGWKRGAVVALALSAIAAIAVIGLSGERFCRNLLTVDKGNVQRIRAWRAAPAMIAAAPDGWGENCGLAYCEWFQDEDDTHVLYYLVNTHLTWMTEKGWLFSGIYIFGWTLLFAMLLSHFRDRWNASALAMWILFFIANWFSTLGFFTSLWVVPVLCTIPAAVAWVRNFLHHPIRHLAILIASPLVAVAVVSGTIAVGKADLAKMDVPIMKDGHAVRVGRGEPAAYVVPDMWALCRYNFGGMGRDIRAWCKNHADGGAIAVVDSIDKLPKNIDRLVLVGCSCREYMVKMKKAATGSSSLNDFPRARQTVFISPNLAIRKISEKLAKALHLKVFTGEFLAEATGDASAKRSWMEIISGCELYLPEWMKLAMDGGAR